MIGAAPSGEAGPMLVRMVAMTATPKAAAVPASVELGEEASGAKNKVVGVAADFSVKGEPLEISLDAVKLMSKTEFYSPENLYEKIDGRAPAYLGFNFQQLRCRSFAVVGAEGSFVDVFEFRMDTPMNAFGIFSLERDPKAGPLEFVTDGYAGEMGFFFRQGAVYVQVIASDRNVKTMAAARAIAGNRAKLLPADDRGLAARRRLPADGLIAESVSFVPENAQGQAFLKEVFQANYRFDGKTLPFFVMAATPQAAGEAWKNFQTFCGRFGKVTVLPAAGGAQIFAAQIFGAWKVVYCRRGELGGVYDADDEGKAREFVAKYLEGRIR